MQKIRFEIAYDGTHYLGWQKTEIGPSICSKIEEVLLQILGEPHEIEGASRTDAGVHADSQVACFTVSKASLDLDKLLKSMNSLLPADIRILKLEPIHLNFHPSLDAIGKKYIYKVSTDVIQYPKDRLFSWHVGSALDMTEMQLAASYLEGTHDFSAFTNTRTPAHTSHLRTIEKIEIITSDCNQVVFIFKGNHFLYKMVRNLVGTLVYVGLGKISSSSVKDILLSLDRTKAGITAPAHGLTLSRVYYEQNNVTYSVSKNYNLSQIICESSL